MVIRLSLVCVVKTLKVEIFLKPGRRKVLPDAHNNAGWQGDSYFLSQDNPTPSNKLPIGIMPKTFVFWALVSIRVLAFVLIPGCLQHPLVSTKGYKAWATRKALWYSFERTIGYGFNVFIDNLGNLVATNTLSVCIHKLAVITLAPK